MKRSEILIQLKSEFRCNPAITAYLVGEISKGRLCEILANAVLNIIEEKGMLPPEVEVLVEIMPQITMYKKKHEWEKE